MELGEPDASGRRRPVVTGNTETMTVHLAIMALGNSPNPIVKDAEPELKTTRWGRSKSIHNPNGPQSKMSTVEVMRHVEVPPRSRLPVMDKMLPMKSSGVPYKRNEVPERVGKALAYTEKALAPRKSWKRPNWQKALSSSGSMPR